MRARGQRNYRNGKAPRGRAEYSHERQPLPQYPQRRLRYRPLTFQGIRPRERMTVLDGETVPKEARRAKFMRFSSGTNWHPFGTFLCIQMVHAACERIRRQAPLVRSDTIRKGLLLLAVLHD